MELFNCITVCDKKWIKVTDLSTIKYSVNKNIRFKTPMLRSNLCDYSDAYIVVKETIDPLASPTNKNGKTETDVTFKSNAPFSLCISKLTTH